MSAYGELAQTMVNSQPDAILTAAPPMTLALQAATRTIPVVTIIGDPVALGLVSSLARPGGNFTGVTVDAGIELHGKRLSLLLEAKPGASRLAYLSSSAGWKQPQAAMVREVAQQLKLSIEHVDLGKAPWMRRAHSAASDLVEKAKPDVMLVSDEPEYLSNSSSLVEVADRARIPAMYPFHDMITAGGLMAYYRDLGGSAFRHAADQMADILNGMKPGRNSVLSADQFSALHQHQGRAKNRARTPVHASGQRGRGDRVSPGAKSGPVRQLTFWLTKSTDPWPILKAGWIGPDALAQPMHRS